MKKIILILIFIAAYSTYAQDKIIDTRGTEFWLAFPPNIHNNANSNDNRLKFGDSLMIYITAETDAKGTITYYDVYGNEYIESFTINNPTDIFQFKLSYYDFEIPGYYSERLFPPNNRTKNFNEQVSKMSFLIETDKDVRVYANSQAVTTSEAMLIYPTKSLGTEYMVMSYTSDPVYAGAGKDRFGSTPSQFLIIASEDETEIDIFPTSPTVEVGENEINIILQKGETYLVQADVMNYEGTDLTGTEVISNKPIAVIGSHQRAKIPQWEDQGTSRDILLEQMPPLQAWGTNAFVVPFPYLPTVVNNKDDFFRVLAYYDNTKIDFNGIEVATLNKSEFVEFPIDEEYNINANKPILVATFKKSSTRNGDLRDGDPFMMVIPTAELYLNSYTFTSVQAYEYNFLRYVKVYETQYVTVIIEEQSLPTLVFDGSGVNANLFKPIPNTNYVYAHLEDIGDGTHTISAATNFGIYIFGIGPANSYGYVGGMNLNPIDHTPPAISSNEECNKVTGKITEKAQIDSKISEVKIIENDNVNFNVTDFTKYAEEVDYTAELQDVFQDGYIKFVAIDSIGLETEIEFEIPGNTIQILADGQNPGVVEIKDSIPIIRDKCYEFTVRNYGKFAKNINNVSLVNGNADLFMTPSSFTLQPGESRIIEICFSPTQPGKTIDSVILGDKCISILAATIEIDAIPDPFPPGYEYSADDCNQTFEYSIFDNRVGDFGLREISIIEQNNCQITVPDVINSEVTKVIINVTDPYQEASFTISAIDSSFTETIITEIIPGFTLEFSLIQSIENIYQMENTSIGVLNCEKVKINNYGKYDIELNDIYFNQNTQFSLPAAQLPLIIKAGEEVEAEICFYPNIASDEFYRDTLNLYYNCVSITLPVEAEADSLFRNGNSKCDIELFLTSGKIGYGYEVSEIYPNPASNSLYFTISTQMKKDLEIELIANSGEKILSENHILPSEGLYKITLDTRDVRSGLYLLLIKSGDKAEIKTVIIEK